ncbi:hypothetical protein K1I37_14780 [Alicyclobacillus acidoterrestris]|uniref:DUF2726 domain-containing protein n=1 Tax=Alicyclobacillus acidoterrestris (strain ATCC 49025 / DSM 3922 / CIP 106132 / NCIMB 13137 / GD3B) TaxID=1356854 RepID=A0A9E6ZE89_ALIAG|nr:hypothetical protein [Alicyclobacillus acidoterrestris]UNO47937.1 hypothetical protein K1I37_14780 [Alicyclobacillus acidoterrestris]
MGKIPCTHDEYVAKVKKIHGDKISIVGRYKGNSKRIALRCNVDGCNNQWETVAWNLIKTNPTGCRVCADRKAALERTLTQDEFESNLYSAHGGKVIALEPYKTANTRILFKDIECGHEWMCTPNNITKTGCPICNISRGERLIKRLLDERGVDYKQQFKFDDCKNVRALPFDFAIFNDGELYTLIEWQGRQHFEPVETFGGDESFEQTRLRDYIKWDYCVSNNIRIAYIPYYTREDDLPEILDGILPPKEVIVSV